MTLDLLLRNPAQPVTPERAGWRWLSYASDHLSGSAPFQTGDDEVCLVNLGGWLTATVDGHQYDLGDRRTPFDDLPRSLYLPPGTAFTVEGQGLLARCAARASAQAAGQVRPIPPESLRVEVRGSGNATRQINHIIPPEFAAHRLLVVEVLTPAGNWSSYPPHKHEVERLPSRTNSRRCTHIGSRPRRRLGSSVYTPRTAASTRHGRYGMAT